MYLYMYTHVQHTKKYPNTYQGDHGCYETHSTLPFTRLGTARSGLQEHATPQSCGACTGDTMRHPRPLLGTAEEGRRKGKGSEAGHEPRHPGERVTCTCYFLKNEVEKILEIL